MTRDELLLRFAALPGEGPARRVRGVALAAALEWCEAFQAHADGTNTKVADLAIDQLLAAAETACEALGA